MSLSAVEVEALPRVCRRYDGRSRAWKPKRRFDTRAEAIAFNMDVKMTAYCCYDCGFWHLGHVGGAKG